MYDLSVRKFYAAAIFLLMAALPALSQIHGAPASVTSVGRGQSSVGFRMQMPNPPASVQSLGPNGWGGAWGNGFHGNVGFGFNNGFNNGFNRFGHHHRGFGFGFGFGAPVVAVPYPVYVTPYPYGYGYPYPYDSYGMDNPYYNPYSDPRPSYPITYNTSDQPPPGVAPSVDDEPPLPTDRQRVRSNDDRYGDHYTDRRERSRRDRDADRDDQEAEAPAPKSNPDSYPATTIVLKDGRQIEMQNYAIVGDYVFDLSSGRARKYRLSDVDLPATFKVNDENGVGFRLPREVHPTGGN